MRRSDRLTSWRPGSRLTSPCRSTSGRACVAGAPARPHADLSSVNANGEVVVGGGGEPRVDHVVGLAVGGERQDARVRDVGRNRAGHVVAVELGQVAVEHGRRTGSAAPCSARCGRRASRQPPGPRAGGRAPRRRQPGARPLPPRRAWAEGYGRCTKAFLNPTRLYPNLTARFLASVWCRSPAGLIPRSSSGGGARGGARGRRVAPGHGRDRERRRRVVAGHGNATGSTSRQLYDRARRGVLLSWRRGSRALPSRTDRPAAATGSPPAPAS